MFQCFTIRQNAIADCDGELLSVISVRQFRHILFIGQKARFDQYSGMMDIGEDVKLFCFYSAIRCLSAGNKFLLDKSSQTLALDVRFLTRDSLQERQPSGDRWSDPCLMGGEISLDPARDRARAVVEMNADEDRGRDPVCEGGAIS